MTQQLLSREWVHLPHAGNYFVETSAARVLSDARNPLTNPDHRKQILFNNAPATGKGSTKNDGLRAQWMLGDILGDILGRFWSEFVEQYAAHARTNNHTNAPTDTHTHTCRHTHTHHIVTGICIQLWLSRQRGKHSCFLSLAASLR